MFNQKSKIFRVLSISLSTRGFGYAVMEGKNALVDYRNTVIRGNKKIRNAGSLIKVENVIANINPDVLVLQDVNAKGIHRAPRIKALHKLIVALAKKQNLKVVNISRTTLTEKLLGSKKGTRYEMAEFIAKQFPDELAARLPSKPRAWESESPRMDMFDAVGLVVAYLPTKTNCHNIYTTQS